MAVIGAPAVMWVLCLGCGLACERALRVRLSNALLLPLGLCAALVVIFPGYAAGAGDALAIPLLVTVAMLGLFFSRRELRKRVNCGWPLLAGLAAYVLYMLPVIAYGHWTWSGYDFVNDSAFEMLLASHIKGYGLTQGHIPLTSEQQFLMSYLNSSYPLGTQSLLGTLSGLTRTDVAVLYQGFIASLAAVGAVALATVPRGLLDGRRAALAGFAAIAANLTYQFALQGDIKEIGLLAILCAGVALGREAISLARPYAGALLMAIVAAAALAVYNAVAVPYIGALALFGALGVLLVHRRLPTLQWLPPALVGGGVAALLAIPSLISFQTFFEIARTGQGSTGVGATQFGQLLRVLPLSQISGVWLSGEYRVPIASHHAGLLTAVATAALLIAIIPAVAWALWRRKPGVPMAVGMVGLVLLVVFPRVSPYAQGKLLAISSPLVVLVGLVGVMILRPGHWLRLLGGVAALSIVAAILVSDLLAYGRDRVAPTARIEAIRQTGEHFAGEGLVLWNEFEEYAKYFARAAKISVPFEALTPQQVQLRSPTYFYGHYFDLDQELLSFVEGYPIIVTRRSPSASRPPANYELVYRNAYYEGWRRMTHPRVLEHLPLQQPYGPSQVIQCAALQPIVAKAPHGSELVVAVAPDVSWFEAASDPKHSGGWNPDSNQPGALATPTAGYVDGVLRIKREGVYALWLQGDFPRAVHVELDGHTVGSVSGSNTPGQWLQAASLHLRPGAHNVRVVKVAGRRHFGPGDWGTGVIGAVALKSEQPEILQAMALSRWHSLCGKEADWVEVVRP
jgi:hypothetical protein